MGDINSDGLQVDVTPDAGIDASDSGFNSRKLWFAIGTSMLIFLGAILSGVWNLFGPHYETMISGLIGVLGLYLTGNVSSRYVTAKHYATMAGQAIAAGIRKDNAPPAPVEPSKD